MRVALNQADAEIIVSDNGPGIPAEQRERLFEPFYRRVRAGEDIGAGLGLALVRQIAQRHGGSAQCVQGDDRHSCFSIRLPAMF